MGGGVQPSCSCTANLHLLQQDVEFAKSFTPKDSQKIQFCPKHACKSRHFWPKLVFNVPNIHLGIYENCQNFYPLIFYGYTRLHGLGQICPPSPWSNRVKQTVSFCAIIYLDTNSLQLFCENPSLKAAIQQIG